MEGFKLQHYGDPASPRLSFNDIYTLDKNGEWFLDRGTQVKGVHKSLYDAVKIARGLDLKTKSKKYYFITGPLGGVYNIHGRRQHE